MYARYSNSRIKQEMKSIMHENLSNYSIWSIYIIHIEYLHNAFLLNVTHFK